MINSEGAIINSDLENMVLILSRHQTIFTCKKANKNLQDITLDDIWPALKIAAANADVVIMMDDGMFSVLKHDFMPDLSAIYHKSTLTNIAFAR